MLVLRGRVKGGVQVRVLYSVLHSIGLYSVLHSASHPVARYDVIGHQVRPEPFCRTLWSHGPRLATGRSSQVISDDLVRGFSISQSNPRSKQPVNHNL
jgi:hypothetical protein